jgi:hypothetical protein
VYQTFFKNARNTQNPGPLTVRLVRGISQPFSFFPVLGKKKTSLRSLVDPRMTKISSPDFQLPGYGERDLLTVPQLIRRKYSFGSFLEDSKKSSRLFFIIKKARKTFLNLFSSLPCGKKASFGCLAHPRMAIPGFFGDRISPCVLPVNTWPSSNVRRNSSFGLFLTNFCVKVTQLFNGFFILKERLCSLLSFGGGFFFQNITDFSPRNRDALPNLTPGSLSRGFFLRLMPGRQEHVAG